MKSSKVSILWLMVLVLVSACRPDQLRPTDYIAWVEDPSNGLHKVRQIGDYQLDLQMMPIAYQSLRQTGGKPDRAMIQEMEKELAGGIDFELRLAPKESGQPMLKHKIANVQQYQDRVQYLAYEMEKHLKLVVGTDTLRPNLYHFERAFDLKPAATCLLSFDRPDPLPEKAHLILDDQLLGMGPVHFQLPLSELNLLPALKY